MELKRTLGTLAMVAMLWAGMPTTAAAPTNPVIYDMCTQVDDEAGMGGTDVSCRYDCGDLNELHIGVKSADPQATVMGDTQCGEARAYCGPDLHICAGISPELTDHAEKDAKCYAVSDEWFDSPLRVWCISIGPDIGDDDPRDVICRLVPEFPTCDNETTLPGLPPVPPTVADVIAWLQAACEGKDTRALACIGASEALAAVCGQVPDLGSADRWIGAILPLVTGAVVAGVDVDGDQGFALRRDAATQALSCSVDDA